MKIKSKKKAALAAAALMTVTGFSACGNRNQDVYGPPIEDSEYEESETEIPESEYDPEENQNATVYGPPTDN